MTKQRKSYSVKAVTLCALSLWSTQSLADNLSFAEVPGNLSFNKPPSQSLNYCENIAGKAQSEKSELEKNQVKHSQVPELGEMVQRQQDDLETFQRKREKNCQDINALRNRVTDSLIKEMGNQANDQCASFDPLIAGESQAIDELKVEEKKLTADANEMSKQDADDKEANIEKIRSLLKFPGSIEDLHHEAYAIWESGNPGMFAPLVVGPLDARTELQRLRTALTDKRNRMMGLKAKCISEAKPQ